MKRFAFVIAASCAAVLALSSCAGTYQKGNKSPETTSAQIDTVSYALGMYFGKMITSSPFGEIDLAQLRKGFNDVLNEKDVMLDETRLGVIIQTHLMTQQAYRALENLKEGEDFLAANKEKEGACANLGNHTPPSAPQPSEALPRTGHARQIENEFPLYPR